MATKTRRMFASTSANAAATIIVPNSIRIVGLVWSARWTSITNGQVLYAELSSMNSAQSQQNDSSGVIDSIRTFVNFATSGLEHSGIQKVVTGIDIPCPGLGYLYINTSFSVTNFECDLFIHYV